MILISFYTKCIIDVPQMIVMSNVSMYFYKIYEINVLWMWLLTDSIKGKNKIVKKTTFSYYYIRNRLLWKGTYI